MVEKLVEFSSLGNRVRRATLVREKSLNSLSLATINLLTEKFDEWLDDGEVACIVLDSSSDRAFCAGADITSLFHAIKEGNLAHADTFFTHEYQLDYKLHNAQKPILVWGNGVVMGGGLGLLSGCSHKVGTPDNRIAMPEITIGLFPDAGATWLLSQLPDKLGVFVGMTGCHLSAGDALKLGILDFVIEPTHKASVFASIEAAPWTDISFDNHVLLSELLRPVAYKGTLPKQLLVHRESVSALIGSADQSENFFPTFEAGLDDLTGDDWLAGALHNYRSGSATTARIFHEQLHRAGLMSFADTLRMELNIAGQCARHPDFPEGVRALLVDKDRKPIWEYTSTAEVPMEYVLDHFQAPWSDHPLADLV